MGSEPCGSRHRHSAASYDHFVRGSRLGVWGSTHLRPGRWHRQAGPENTNTPGPGSGGVSPRLACEPRACQAACSVGTRWCQWSSDDSSSAAHRYAQNRTGLGELAPLLMTIPSGTDGATDGKPVTTLPSLHVMGPRPSGWGLGTARAVTIQNFKGLWFFELQNWEGDPLVSDGRGDRIGASVRRTRGLGQHQAFGAADAAAARLLFGPPFVEGPEGVGCQ